MACNAQNDRAAPPVQICVQERAHHCVRPANRVAAWATGSHGLQDGGAELRRRRSGKGPNLAGIDPLTGELTRLFCPRRDEWNEHFAWQGPELVGRTAIGRTTVDVLNINLPERLEHRRLLLLAGELRRA
jgi:hypothetical protein